MPASVAIPLKITLMSMSTDVNDPQGRAYTFAGQDGGDEALLIYE
jgi:hypothetical protein